MSAISFGVTLALAMALAAGGYWAGDHNRNNACQAAQTTQALQAGKTLLAEALRGQDAAAQSITEQQALQKSYSILEGKFHALIQLGPIVVFRDRDVGVGHRDAGLGHIAPGQSSQEAPVPPSGGVGGASAVVGLSRGAVWVWNSALAGQDSPVNTCGAADTASPACAADSGLGLADAWDNHITNARTCAQDRLRHQQLIDYIKGTPQ